MVATAPQAAASAVQLGAVESIVTSALVPHRSQPRVVQVQGLASRFGPSSRRPHPAHRSTPPALTPPAFRPPAHQAACSALSWLLQAPTSDAAAEAAVRAGAVDLPKVLADVAFPKLATEPLTAVRSPAR